MYNIIQVKQSEEGKMSKKQMGKIIFLNACIIILNIIIFSEGILGFSISSDNTLVSALSITTILMSIIVFAYGNYKLIKSLYSKASYIMEDLDSPKEYEDALLKYRNKAALSENINTLINQISQLERKKKSLETVLFQKYQDNAEDFDSLNQIVEDTGKLMFENIRKILSRMEIFDQKEYERLKMDHGDSEIIYAKMQIYKEHMLYVRKYIDKNEAILIQFDNLLIEVSKIGDTDEGEKGLDNLEAIVASMKKLRSGDNGISELEKKYSK